MGLVNIKKNKSISKIQKKKLKEGFTLPDFGKAASDTDKAKDSSESAGGGGIGGMMDAAKPSNKSSGCRLNCTKNNWWAFLMGCLYYLVYVLMLGMIGANFIFFATLPQGTADVPGPTLNDFFPTYVTQYLVFDDPYGPLPQIINDASLNKKKDVINKAGKNNK